MLGQREFLCLCCVQCQTFQNVARTKQKKWACKVCGTRQSVMRIYGVSANSADIRALVQQKNLERGSVHEEEEAVGVVEEKTSGICYETPDWEPFLEKDAPVVVERDEAVENVKGNTPAAVLLRGCGGEKGKRVVGQREERKRVEPVEKKAKKEKGGFDAWKDERKVRDDFDEPADAEFAAKWASFL